MGGERTHGILAAAIAITAIAGVSVRADMTFDATHRGLYRSDGAVNTGPAVSLADTYTGAAVGFTHRSYFVFDLTSLNSSTVTSATLRLEVAVWLAGNAAEAFDVYEITTDVADLVDGGASATIYTDVGSGVVYGTGAVSSSDVGSVVEVTLGASAIDAINAASGNSFAVGLDLSSIDGTTQPITGFEGVRFSTSNEVRTHQLFVEAAPIPAPSAAFLGLVGLAMTSCVRRRFA